MTRNFLKIAFRNLWRRKGFTFINIMGLAVGLTACFLIFLYVSFERSYDRFHTNTERIYRLVTDVKTPSETINAPITSWAFAPAMKADFPEVASFVRVLQTNMVLRKDDKTFQEDKILLADSSFFQVFDFKLVQGNRDAVLKAPFSLVLSASAAKKYFGTANALGQTLLVNGGQQGATVTGIMEDMPLNSQLQADILLSMTTQTLKFNPNQDREWSNFGVTTFLLLQPGTQAAALERKFPAFFQRHTGKEMQANQMYFTAFLEPLKDVYLRSTRGGFAQGSSSNVTTFSIIAVFILLIAGINFVNLSTARSAERAKEVGIRKVVGAERFQVARQFVAESLLLSFIAFVFALGLSALLLPLFNQLAGKTVSPHIFSDGMKLLWLFVAAIGSGLLAGIYPAMVLSSFRPVAVLKGRFANSSRGVVLRKGLVVVQFTISIALIIGTLVVYHQMQYMRNRKLGFNKEQVLVLDTDGNPARFALKEKLAGLPGVKATTLSSSVPGGLNPAAYSEIENSKGDMQVANLDLYFVDFGYIPQYGIQMAAGRPFSEEFKTDTTQAIVLNEAAVKLLGYTTPEQAIGRRFSQWGREGKIIGVMKDFHFRSLQQPIKPLSMRIEPRGANLVSVRLAGAGASETIAAIEKQWKSMIPGRPFSYYFLDEFFDRQYRSEERFGNLFLNFAILAIFISCLGLLGLASYSTIQRTKEIGIRKVIGATTVNIVHLLSRNFLQLVVIAFLVAVPAAWILMNQWLQDFAYRINIGWWVFLLAGILALVIAFLTVSFLAVRAAIANPVKSLRSE